MGTGPEMERDKAVRLLVACELLRSSLDRGQELNEPEASAAFRSELDAIARWAEGQVDED